MLEFTSISWFQSFKGRTTSTELGRQWVGEQPAVGLAVGQVADDDEDRVAVLLQLGQVQRQVRVRQQLRAGQQRVQVEPLAAQPPHGQPVVAVVADERILVPATNASDKRWAELATFRILQGLKRAPPYHKILWIGLFFLMTYPVLFEMFIGQLIQFLIQFSF